MLETTVSLGEGGTRAGAAAAYLLVVEGSSSALFPLPPNGTVVIGRAPECDLQLTDNACSRRHAMLHITDGEVTLEDLGSHNGTRVNGEPVQGSRQLTGDDILSIGPIKLVLHAGEAKRVPLLLDAATLRDRLAQEVARTASYERPLTVAVVALARDRSRELVEQTLASSLRLVDAAGRVDDDHLAVLLVELAPEAATAHAEQLLATLVPHGAVGMGLAHCPADGHRGAVLIAAARAASDAGRPGVQQARDCVSSLPLEDATVLVADPAMIHVYDLLKRLAASELTVLISGETGVGKENAALAVHQWSARSRGPFVAINCASLPETLVESELFGFEKGAFSGAAAAKPGRLEAANGGTVFFDEIGELPLPAQAKLLRALEARRVTRLGALKEVTIDVRVVAATNRDLVAEVKGGRFREDLYFRLSAAKVVLPPLRDRQRELALLARFFLDRAATAAGRGAPTLSAAAMAQLARHAWPGNVRELKNEMEFVVATVTDAVVEPWHLSERLAPAPPADGADAPPEAGAPQRPIADEIRELERRRMKEALAAAKGVQKHAAALLGMPVRTFTMKYKQYGLGDD